MEIKHFDIAVLGAGCSGFQLLHQLSLQPDWTEKKVALLGKKELQERSWCFWSEEKHDLQHLVVKSWQNLIFKGRKETFVQNIAPYHYHYIPGIAFFDFFQNQFLPQHKNINVFEKKVANVTRQRNDFEVSTEDFSLSAEQVFSSLPPNITAQKPSFWLKQHFKGWFLQSEEAIFDADTMTLMDFSIEQNEDTRFVYILPFSAHEALVEMTVFSPNTYEDSTYDQVLTSYMQTHFQGKKYNISSTEKGQIPMTNALFARKGAAGEVLLGTAAGMVKSSTGYAFNRITKDSRQLAEDVHRASSKLRWANTKGRFKFYDRLLLGILSEEPLKGQLIFEALFQKVGFKKILRFLDEKTTIWEEISIFWQLPFAPFLKQIYRQW